MKKRVIALLLTLSMAVTAVPGTVWAEEPAGGGEEAVIEEVGEEMEEVEVGEAAGIEAAADTAAPADVAEDVIVEDGVEIEAMEEISVDAPEAEEIAAPTEIAVPEVELVQDTGIMTTANATALSEVELTMGNVKAALSTKGESADTPGTLDGSAEIKVPYDPAEMDAGEPGKNGFALFSTASGTREKLNEGPDYTLEYTKSTSGDNVIKISFVAEGKCNDLVSANSPVWLKFEIEPRSLKDNKKDIEYTIKSVPEGGTMNADGTYHFIYNGKSQVITDFEVSDKGYLLEKDKDYEVEAVADPEKVGIKTVKIDGKLDGNYADNAAADLFNYTIDPKKAAAGDIEVPDLVIRAGTASFASAETNVLKKGIIDNLSGAELDTQNYTVAYYPIENGVESNTALSGKTPFTEAPAVTTKYAYYILPTAGSNYAVETGKPQNLRGVLEVRPEAASTMTLKEAYEEIQDKIDYSEYEYDGTKQFDITKTNSDNITETEVIGNKILNAFESVKTNFKTYVILTASKDIVDIGKYEITISPNTTTSRDQWKGQDPITVHVEIVPAKINGSDNGWNTVLQGSAATLTATQGRNLDGSSTGHKVIVDGEIKWDDKKGPGTPSSGVALVKDIDYVVEEGTPDSKGIVKTVKIKGIGNFTSERELDVKQDEKVKLELLKDSAKVTPKSDGTVKEEDIEIKDKAGAVIPASGNYTITDQCCKNEKSKHTKTGRHTVTVEGTGNCTGSIKIEFIVNGEEFGNAYKADTAALKNPKVDTVTSEAPHNTVVVKSTTDATVFLSNTKDYTWSYVWADDPETDEAKKLTIKQTQFEKEGIVYGGKKVAAKTFPEMGAWKLVLEPAKDLDGGKYSGKIEVPFTVEPKEFKEGTIEIKTASEGIEWPGETVPEKTLAEKLTVKDITDGAAKAVELKYGTDYVVKEIAGNDKIGEATLTLSGKEGSKYDSQTMTAKVKITAKSLKGADVKAADGALGYAGVPVKDMNLGSKDVVVTLNDVVVDPSEYDVKFEASEEYAAGTKVAITVTAKEGGNYTDSAFGNAEIVKANIGSSYFKLEGATDQYLYDVEEGVKQTGLKLKDLRFEDKYVEIVGEDAYEYEYENAETKLGKAKVKVRAADETNYTGTAAAEFQVLTAADGNVELKADITYTGKDLTMEEVVERVTDKNGKELKGWTAAFVGDHKNAGQGVVEVTLAGGNKITQVFEIKPAEIKASDVTFVDKTPFTYTGSVIRPKVQVTVNGVTLKETTDYYVMNTEEIRTGKMNLVVAGIGNYTSSPAKDFEVVPATLDGAKISNVKATYKYTGQVIRPEAKVTLNGKKLVKGKDYQLLNTESAEVGKKDLVVLGIGGYEGSSKLVNFVVKPAKAEVKSVEEGTNQLTVKVKKQSGASYQVKYRVKGTSEWKSAKVKEGSAKKVLKDLTSGKKYQVKVRAYVTVDGERVNGAWSAVKVSGKVK